MRVALACAAVLATAACSAGEDLEVVVDSVVTSTEQETAVLTEEGQTHLWWEQVGGPATDIPGGHVEVVVGADYRLSAPEITRVRSLGDTWVIHLRGGRVADCAAPDVVRSVVFLLHVRADAPPERARVEVDERPGC